MKNYIGLSCTMHDAAIAIVDSKGEVVFAEATERRLGSKRAWHRPPDDVLELDEILDRYAEPGAELVVAKSWRDAVLEQGDLNLALQDQMFALYKDLPDDQERFLRFHSSVSHFLTATLKPTVRQTGAGIRFRTTEGDRPLLAMKEYDHHETHAAYACVGSPFDEAVCVVIDGFGEGRATAFFHYQDGGLSPIPEAGAGVYEDGRFDQGASLGFFYLYLCFACGFDGLRGEEWKVMGLAPYGKRDGKVYEGLRSIFRVDGLRVLLDTDEAFPRLAELLDMRRKPDTSPLEAADLAHTGQEVFCDVMGEVLDGVRKLGISDNLVLTGGCALNSAWNGRLLDRVPFSRLHVPSAPGDDGNAIGAALLAYAEDQPPTAAPALPLGPYLGSSIDREALERVETLGGLRSSVVGDAEVLERAAELLADGRIIGWIQGRAEFGPRALGNRSILADPRPADMKERINAQVKLREEFRPFAPSILDEYGDEYFENYLTSPFMERALRFRPAAAARVPGVVHVDGTGRLQSVRRDWNPLFYELISGFHARTGVPLLLNTSFNVMGKPIVHSVEDAVAVLYTSGLDALVIEDRIFEKSS